MSAAASSSDASENGRRSVEVSISVRTVLLVAAAVAIAWAAASISSVLLVIFVSLFNVAVLSPVVNAMERRFNWSRALAATVLVLATTIVVALIALVLVEAIADGVHDLSHALPHLVDQARHTHLGRLLNSGSGAMDTLKAHAGDITRGVGRASGGVAHIGVSAFGAVTLVLSVVFLTLFGLVDAPRWRDWIAGLLYPDARARYLDVGGRIVNTTSRYMLGNIAISVICGTVYGITAWILGVPYPLAIAVIAGILDLIPNIGATLAGIVIALVSLSVSFQTMVIFLIVIVVYQQVENYILQPTIIGKAAKISGFSVLVSVLVFGALFGVIGAIIGVPIAAAVQIVVEELTSGRRARIAAEEADAAETS
jgi:predicted PurR-regulated permease PerM